MKNLFLFGLVVLLFSACGDGGAAGGKDALVGKWQLDAVSGENLTDSEKTATIEFSADGKFKSARKGKVRSEGTWELSEDGKTLTTIPDGKEKEVQQIQELNGKKFVFKSDRGDIVTFKKI